MLRPAFTCRRICVASAQPPLSTATSRPTAPRLRTFRLADDAPVTPGMRTVHCCDALVWLAQQESLPCVVTSLPDVTELSLSNVTDLAGYDDWMSSTAATIVGKLRPGAVAVFYQTDSAYEGSYVSKSSMVTRGGLAAGGVQLWHKICLRAKVGSLRSAKMPTFSHLLAFAGPRGGVTARAESCSIPDVFDRGDMVWSRATGFVAAQKTCQWLKHELFASSILDPFCGSGTILAAANHVGLAATGVEINAKRARHALVMQVCRDADGALMARRSTDVGFAEEEDEEVP